MYYYYLNNITKNRDCKKKITNNLIQQLLFIWLGTVRSVSRSIVFFFF